MKQKIILASSSLRRKRILREAGIEFRAIAPRINENAGKALPPRKHVEELAEKKAEEVARRVKGGIVIGADTLLACKGKKLGKPKNAKQASAMLRHMSGCRVDVYTGVAVIDAKTGRKVVGSEKATLAMKRMAGGEIREYVRTGEPIGKAGAIAIQGIGAKFISTVRGSKSNVMGLPIALLRRSLGKFGVKIA